jgi:hypothetical protein
MSDFIPEDVLFALTQPPPVKDQLGPPSRTRNLNKKLGIFIRKIVNGINYLELIYLPVGI